MSRDDLLHGRYRPFLLFEGYESIKRFVPFSAFRSEQHKKSYAVSADGKTLRMVLQPHGYHDRFQIEDGNLVLVYVCGVEEEQRRQNLNRSKDRITIVIDDKHGLHFKKDSHGVLLGEFDRIVAWKESKCDAEMLVPHSHIRIVGYSTPKDGNVLFGDAIQRESSVKRQRLHGSRTHIVLDTESASPLQRTAARHEPFPVLQLAFERLDDTFRESVQCSTFFLRYPTNVRNRLGNDENTSILKFSPLLLECGDDVHRVLEAFFEQLRRVVQSDGFLFAHNVRHDIEQIRKSAELVGFPLPNLTIRAIDTVKTAPNFVPGAENRWMKLGDLAHLCGVAVDGTLHRADVDTRTLVRIVQGFFPPDALDSYVETYTL